jgi:hypothetical protein
VHGLIEVTIADGRPRVELTPERPQSVALMAQVHDSLAASLYLPSFALVVPASPRVSLHTTDTLREQTFRPQVWQALQCPTTLYCAHTQSRGAESGCRLTPIKHSAFVVLFALINHQLSAIVPFPHGVGRTCDSGASAQTRKTSRQSSLDPRLSPALT